MYLYGKIDPYHAGYFYALHSFSIFIQIPAISIFVLQTLQTLARICKFTFLFPSPKHVVGAQKNHLNETKAL